MTDTIPRHAATRPTIWADEMAEPGEDRIEPKLRARRIQVRQEGRRRRRRVILSLVALIVLSAAGVGSLYSPWLDLDHLDIEGLRHLEPDAVADASGLSTGQQLVDLDTDLATSRIDHLPWVERVIVTRRWPDTVEVRIVEREPVAIVVGPDGSRLVVTRDGMVAGPALSLDDALPTLGLDAAVVPVVGQRLPERIARSVQMVGALPKSIATRSAGARIDATGLVEVDLGLGAVLVLGDGEDAAAKFVEAETLLSGVVSLNCLEKVDVSVPSASVIVRADGCR